VQSRVRALEESGFGSFPGFRHSTRFALLPRTPYQSLCALLLFSVLADFQKKPLRRGGSGWLLSIRFRFAALPATHASWNLRPESGKRIRPVDK
jgi:hypothetical protein